MKSRKKSWLAVLAAALIVVCGCLAYIHRRVIRAAIKGEPLPECPHWHPHLKRKPTEEPAEEAVQEAAEESAEEPAE